MEKWNELKNKPTKTDEEKIVVVCVEAIHASDAMATESEEKTYRNLCARVGVTIDGENEAPVPDDDEDETDNTKDDSEE